MKKGLARISVIIPTYNRAQTIGYCLDSVVNQTYQPLEIIVVDDCSTDETLAAVNSTISAGGPKIRFLKLPAKLGAQAARNRGIKAARGNWIAFQDSDDEWLPEKLAKQMEILRTIDYDPFTVIHTNAIFRETATGREIPADLAVEGEDVYPVLLRRIGPMFQGMLVSREALRLIDYLDEKVPSYQEWDTAIRLSVYCRFIFIPEPLFIYHLHEGETISKNKRLDFEGYRYVIRKFEPEIKTHCGIEAWEEHLRLLNDKNSF